MSSKKGQDELAKKLYRKAQEYTSLGKHDKAEYLCYRAAAITLDNYEHVKHLAISLVRQNKLVEALNIYLFLAAKAPNKELNIRDLKTNIIRHTKLTNDHELLKQSIRVFQRIIEIANKRSCAIDFLGELYWELGRKKKTLELKRLAATENAVNFKNLSISRTEIVELIQNKNLSRLPDFLIVGPQKSGTTALYQYLAQHPNIYPALSKEIFFFDNKYDLGLDWYKSHFALLPQFNYLTGEASATYFNSVKAANRIAQLMPNIRLIFIIRDPVERTISDYHMKVRAGTEKRNIKESILGEIEFIQQNPVDVLNPDKKFTIRHKSYVLNGMYFYFLKAYRELFPVHNTTLILSQELKYAPRETMKKVFSFLGVEDFEGEYPLVNVGNYSNKDEELSFVTEKLKKFFSPYNKMLEELINIKLDWS
jgi:tetratricopeptide (TPR) repeat protein